MRVKMVCNMDGETQIVELPMEEESLLEIQGRVLDRDTAGYITGADVKYYNEIGEEIDNIFLLNCSLSNHS